MSMVGKGFTLSVAGESQLKPPDSAVRTEKPGALSPRVVEAIKSLPVQSCFIDGEAIVLDQRGPSAFDLLRSWRHDHAAVVCAFDLIELDSKDLRQELLEERKHTLANVQFRGP
jgi:ATP-dependent DNA ligase